MDDLIGQWFIIHCFAVTLSRPSGAYIRNTQGFFFNCFIETVLFCHFYDSIIQNIVH